MIAVLLFACLPEAEESGETETTSLDVDVGPREFSARFTPEEMDCTSNDSLAQSHAETMGTVSVTNFEDRWLTVAVQADWPMSQSSWVAASFDDDSSGPIDPGESIGFTVSARGNCADGAPVEVGDHVFDFYVAVANVHYDIAATITVE